MSAISEIRGVYPMLLTLFDEGGAMSQAAINAEIDAMVRHQVHGVGVLGLASEVNKLTHVERHQLMEWVAERLNGALPLCVTIAEPNIPAQVAFARAAEGLGAQWVILQPPPVMGIPEIELMRFFGSVADKCNLPVAIQNAPQYLGTGLSMSSLIVLRKNHPNIKILKLESTAVEIARLVEQTDGAYAIFNGRAGLEMTDAIRAGCIGIIPGGECFDVLSRIFDGMMSKNEAEMRKADLMYRRIVPLLTVLMSSVDQYLIHGKRVACRRLGLKNEWVRAPTAGITEFGSMLIDNYADELGRL
jgi:4-hydroxy-tetrahydrodipicolinate synthase